jgi:hypothetical protein
MSFEKPKPDGLLLDLISGLSNLFLRENSVRRLGLRSLLLQDAVELLKKTYQLLRIHFVSGLLGD